MTKNNEHRGHPGHSIDEVVTTSGVIACGECGVYREVMMHQEKGGIGKFIDERDKECPVCGYIQGEGNE